MKQLKLILLSCVLTFAVTMAIVTPTHAQSGFFQRASDRKTTDTLTNAATSSLQLPISGFQNPVSVQALITKLTGTTAGVARLFGSLDGTNYVRINPTDSLTLSNVSGVQSKIFVVPNSPYAYYQVRTAGSGTQTTKIQAYAIWRKP